MCQGWRWPLQTQWLLSAQADVEPVTKRHVGVLQEKTAPGTVTGVLMLLKYRQHLRGVLTMQL